MPHPSATERLWTTIPSARLPDLDARAAEESLQRKDWIRKTLIDALDGPSAIPDITAVGRDDLNILAAWIDRRIQAQEAKQKCDMNAIFSFLTIVLQETMHAEAFARSAATAYLPDGMTDEGELVEEHGRDALARCAAHIEDFNHNILGEARDEGRRREAAADASLDGLKERLEERPS